MPDTRWIRSQSSEIRDPNPACHVSRRPLTIDTITVASRAKPSTIDAVTRWRIQARMCSH